MSIRKRVWVKGMAKVTGQKLWRVTFSEGGRKITKEFNSHQAADKFGQENGLLQVVWVVDYKDQNGKRRHKKFVRKKDAEAWWNGLAGYEVAQGIHTADSESPTVAEAGKRWIATCAGLERSTVDYYEQHLKYHLVPLIGSTKLSKLTVASVRDLQAKLRESGRSEAMVKKVVTSLGALLSEAQIAGLVNRNVVYELRASRRRRQEKKVAGRHKRRLQVGIEIPDRGEIRAMLDNMSGHYRPFLLTAIFTGLRCSELRGLLWEHVDFDNRLIKVRQRADRWNQIGPPKSEAGVRDVPMTPLVLNTLREWKLACPRPYSGEVDEDGKRLREAPRPQHLVFPNGAGKVDTHSNIWNRGLVPAQVAAGVALDSGKLDEEENPIFKAKYGVHALRHFYASWLINRREDGGLGLPAMVVQERLGHGSIQTTMDIYGHLFPSETGYEELAEAERLLLA